MNLTAIVQSIDAEIMRLERIRALLSGTPARKRKKVSREARARMAAAQKKRWAKVKK